MLNQFNAVEEPPKPRLSVVYEGLTLRCHYLFVVIGCSASDVAEKASTAATSNTVADGAEGDRVQSGRVSLQDVQLEIRQKEAVTNAVTNSYNSADQFFQEESSTKTDPCIQDFSAVSQSGKSRRSGGGSQASQSTLKSGVSQASQKSPGKKKVSLATDCGSTATCEMNTGVPSERDRTVEYLDSPEFAIFESEDMGPQRRAANSLSVASEGCASFFSSMSRCPTRFAVSRRLSEVSQHFRDFDRELDIHGDERGIYCIADDERGYVCRIRFHNVCTFKDTLPSVQDADMLRNTCYVFLVDTRSTDEIDLDKAAQSLAELRHEFSSKIAGKIGSSNGSVPGIRSRVVLHQSSAWGEEFDYAALQNGEADDLNLPSDPGCRQFFKQYASAMQAMRGVMNPVGMKADFNDEMSLYAILQEICQEMYALNSDPNRRSSANMQHDVMLGENGCTATNGKKNCCEIQ